MAEWLLGKLPDLGYGLRLGGFENILSKPETVPEPALGLSNKALQKEERKKMGRSKDSRLDSMTSPEVGCLHS